jgi:hypothetical protein
LNTKILVKKSRIEKLAGIKSNLEAFLFSLVVTIYFYYSVIINAQVQIQKNLRIVLLISNFNYIPLLCIVTKPKKFVRSKFKIEQNNNKKKGERKKKQKTVMTKRKVIDNSSRSLVGKHYEREIKYIILKEIDNSEINHLYESIKRLRIFRNICSRISIRHSLTNLTYELLVSSIPIIAFIGAIASISDYNTYNVFLLRVLFSISISIAITP